MVRPMIMHRPRTILLADQNYDEDNEFKRIWAMPRFLFLFL